MNDLTQEDLTPNLKFRGFSKEELEQGLKDMIGNHNYSEELREAIRKEIIFRIENPSYEQDCRAYKVLKGGRVI